jgi:hypothetical protein
MYSHTSGLYCKHIMIDDQLTNAISDVCTLYIIYEHK